MLAVAAAVSPSTVGRIWRAHGLKPHRVKTFKLSNDPTSHEKVAAGMWSASISHPPGTTRDHPVR